MPSVKLTDAFLRKIDRPESGVVRYWDTDLRGFVAHVQKNVTTLYYDRNNRRHLIGRYPTVNMPQARETARELDYQLRRGYAKRVTRSNPKLAELIESYCARPKLRSEKWKAFVRHAIETDLGWANRRVSDVTPAMCRDARRRLVKRGPTAANSILQALGTVWAYARRQDAFLPEPPTFGIEWYPEAKALNAPIRDLVVWAAGGGSDRQPGASCCIPLRSVHGPAPLRDRRPGVGAH